MKLYSCVINWLKCIKFYNSHKLFDKSSSTPVHPRATEVIIFLYPCKIKTSFLSIAMNDSCTLKLLNVGNGEPQLARSVQIFKITAENKNESAPKTNVAFLLLLLLTNRAKFFFSSHKHKQWEYFTAPQFLTNFQYSLLVKSSQFSPNFLCENELIN